MLSMVKAGKIISTLSTRSLLQFTLMRAMSSYPTHAVIAMPSLSPTMVRKVYIYMYIFTSQLNLSKIIGYMCIRYNVSEMFNFQFTLTNLVSFTYNRLLELSHRGR